MSTSSKFADIFTTLTDAIEKNPIGSFYDLVSTTKNSEIFFPHFIDAMNELIKDRLKQLEEEKKKDVTDNKQEETFFADYEACQSDQSCSPHNIDDFIKKSASEKLYPKSFNINFTKQEIDMMKFIFFYNSFVNEKESRKIIDKISPLYEHYYKEKLKECPNYRIGSIYEQCIGNTKFGNEMYEKFKDIEIDILFGTNTIAVLDNLAPFLRVVDGIYLTGSMAYYATTIPSKKNCFFAPRTVDFYLSNPYNLSNVNILEYLVPESVEYIAHGTYYKLDLYNKVNKANEKENDKNIGIVRSRKTNICVTRLSTKINRFASEDLRSKRNIYSSDGFKVNYKYEDKYNPESCQKYIMKLRNKGADLDIFVTDPSKLKEKAIQIFNELNKQYKYIYLTEEIVDGVVKKCSIKHYSHVKELEQNFHDWEENEYNMQQFVLGYLNFYDIEIYYIDSEYKTFLHHVPATRLFIHYSVEQGKYIAKGAPSYGLLIDNGVNLFYNYFAGKKSSAYEVCKRYYSRGVRPTNSIYMNKYFTYDVERIDNYVQFGIFPTRLINPEC